MNLWNHDLEAKSGDAVSLRLKLHKIKTTVFLEWYNGCPEASFNYLIEGRIDAQWTEWIFGYKSWHEWINFLFPIELDIFLFLTSIVI